jgi:hypothetical protein
MRAMWLILMLLILVVAVVGCPVASAPTATGDGQINNEKKLSQDTIDDALAFCQDKETWSLSNLAVMRVNYRVGAPAAGVIVLHNGSDAERIVAVSYYPIREPKSYSGTGLTYNPAPLEASNWVDIDTNFIRLRKMQTEVVWVHLQSPSDYEFQSKYWEFDIQADGRAVMEYKQELVQVVTEAGESTLHVRLHQPLLLDSVLSVLSIKSSKGENLFVEGYNPSNQVLTIGGLRPDSEREITIIYEYGSMVTIPYKQRWLITML